jgi:hypothetical protein
MCSHSARASEGVSMPFSFAVFVPFSAARI